MALMHSRTVSLALLHAVLAVPLASSQTTWFVDQSGTPPGTGTASDPFTSLQFAIAAPTTVDGDRIDVTSGTYAEAVDFLGKAITVEGTAGGLEPWLVAPAGAGSAVRFRSGEGRASVLRNVRLTGGDGTVVAGFPSGGGALIQGASPTFDNVSLVANTAYFGAGALVADGRPLFSNCTFQGNLSERGGALYVTGASDVAVDDCRFESNVADPFNTLGYGGAIYVEDGRLSVERSTFEQNWTRNFGGGGAIAVASAGQATAFQCVFQNNWGGEFSGPGRGGAVFAMGEFEGRRCQFLRNGTSQQATGGGQSAGACQGGTYFDCLFKGNVAQLGGAIASASATRCRFVGNDGSADGSGRGGAADFSTLTECTLDWNVACGQGGAASNSTLVDCVVRWNQAIPAEGGVSGVGGGLYQCTAEGTLLQANIAVSAASSPARGGGAFNSDLARCVVVSNHADEGGGIWNTDTLHVSVVGNTATQGGALDGGSTFSPAMHRSTLVWGNVPADVLGVQRFEYSNVEGALPPTGASNLAAAPQLVGPAGSDVHLGQLSPCIDAGDPASAVDPDGSRADIGALPFDATWTAQPRTFCTTAGFSADAQARLVPTGAASVSGASTLSITAVGLPTSTFGVFFYGTEPSPSAPSAAGLLRGAVCVGGGLYRLLPQMATSGAGPYDGEISDVIGTAELAGAGLAPGDRVYAQCWFRRSFGSAFTDAVEAPVIP